MDEGAQVDWAAAEQEQVLFSCEAKQCTPRLLDNAQVIIDKS